MGLVHRLRCLKTRPGSLLRVLQSLFSSLFSPGRWLGGLYRKNTLELLFLVDAKGGSLWVLGCFRFSRWASSCCFCGWLCCVSGSGWSSLCHVTCYMGKKNFWGLRRVLCCGSDLFLGGLVAGVLHAWLAAQLRSRFAGECVRQGISSNGDAFMIGLEVLVGVGSCEAGDRVVGFVCAYYVSVQVEGCGGVVAVEEG